MSVRKIQYEQLLLFRQFLKFGWYYKFALLLSMIPVAYFLYYYIGGHNNRIKESERLTDTGVLILAISLSIFFSIIILTIKAVNFANSNEITRANRLFKFKLFEYLQDEIPELKFSQAIQKIHPNLFRDSQLFETNYEDYIGDDFTTGEYKGKVFDLCELHVFRLFKNIFRGLFLVTYLKKNIENSDSKIEIIQQSDELLELTKIADIKMSYNKGRFYISVYKKELFFENNDPQLITKLDEDIILLKRLINLCKKSIDILES